MSKCFSGEEWPEPVSTSFTIRSHKSEGKATKKEQPAFSSDHKTKLQFTLGNEATYDKIINNVNVTRIGAIFYFLVIDFIFLHFFFF